MRGLLRLSALAGILSPIILAMATAIVAAQRPDYSHITSALSELGAVGRPYATLMNLTGIIPAGLLTVLSAPTIYDLFGRGRLSRAGEFVLMLAGLGFIATAAFAWQGAPTDLTSVNNKLHLTFALSGFFCLALAPLLFGLHARTSGSWRYWFSLLAAALVFVFGFVLPRPPYLGLFQRGALAAFFAWLVVMSAQAIWQDRRAN